eukprot:scaffold644_cov357-Pavlova_lutheri.AAC.26
MRWLGFIRGCHHRDGLCRRYHRIHPFTWGDAGLGAWNAWWWSPFERAGWNAERKRIPVDGTILGSSMKECVGMQWIQGGRRGHDP